MRILIVGAGDIGFQLSRRLFRERTDITIVATSLAVLHAAAGYAGQPLWALLAGSYNRTPIIPLPEMIRNQRGRIVNVSSISGKIGSPLLSAYCASKWGLIGLTKTTAEEVRNDGVHVFAVCPGSVDTEMLKEGRPGAEPDMSAEDVMNVIVYLAIFAPEAMTGSAVDVASRVGARSPVEYPTNGVAVVEVHRF